MKERVIKRKSSNQGVSSAFRQSRPNVVRDTDQPQADHRSFSSPRIFHDSVRTGVGPFVTTMFQPKLTVNEPGDQFEREADRVAGEVMRMEGSCSQSLTSLHAGKHIHRKVPLSEMPIVSPDVKTTIDEMHGRGRPLDPDTRSFMEPRFGQSFADVRVHTDDRAVDASRALNALAFTIGNEIAFGAGQYQPDHISGQQLIAHELTHVVQQSGANGKQIGPSNGCQVQRYKAPNRIPPIPEQAARDLARAFRNTKDHIDRMLKWREKHDSEPPDVDFPRYIREVIAAYDLVKNPALARQVLEQYFYYSGGDDIFTQIAKQVPLGYQNRLLDLLQPLGNNGPGDYPKPSDGSATA